MPLSIVDLYTKILPKTNCKDCGFPTCLAFAGMVVSEKHPLKNCPHIPDDILTDAQAELEKQYKQGLWLKKDMAQEALDFAKHQTASMNLRDIAQRIGGKFETDAGIEKIVLPYFNTFIDIFKDRICHSSGKELSRNEQTFIFIHMARGGNKLPSGNTKSFKEFPNTVSKIVSMEDRVEEPLVKAFSGKKEDLEKVCTQLGATNVTGRYQGCDLAFFFTALPMIPVTLLFWDTQEDFDAQIKLMFDETIIEHLDIEAIMFLCEELVKLLSKNR